MEGLLLELGLEFRYGDGKVLDTQPHLTRELASCHCILRLNLIKGSFNIVKGVHESSWAGLRGFFDPTHHGWLIRQLQIQNICLPSIMLLLPDGMMRSLACIPGVLLNFKPRMPLCPR